MTQTLKRKIGLLQATAINMIDMVGIGPFVVIPLVIQYFQSPLFIWAWIFGAIIAFFDGMIWSELGAAFPRAGGSYVFLRASYGEKYGKLMSFLFVWQTSIQAPLVVASGSIGFTNYLMYLVPLNYWQMKATGIALILLLTFLLYRKTETIGKISIFLWAGLITTFAWIIIGGFSHKTISINIWPEHTGDFLQLAFWAAVGQGSVKTIYCYLGYYNVCHLGGEIKKPEVNIPRSIFISIAGITVLYLALNLSICGVIPWRELRDQEFVVSIFIEKIYGTRAALLVTILILWIAFASLFAVLLGYSRIPYAAATDGNFFKIFSRLHPTKDFPHVSLLFIAGLGILFSLTFNLKGIISAILAMRILTQFIAQAFGVLLLRKEKKGKPLPFKMALYPLPVIASICIWLFIFFSTGWYAVSGTVLTITGLLIYLFKSDFLQTFRNPAN